MVDKYSYNRLTPSAQWALRWQVRKLQGQGEYIVAMKADGTWGCSCPAWTMGQIMKKRSMDGARADCKHIRMIQANEPESYITSKRTVEWKPNRFTEEHAKKYGGSNSIANRSNAEMASELIVAQQKVAREEQEQKERVQQRRAQESTKSTTYKCMTCNRQLHWASDRLAGRCGRCRMLEDYIVCRNCGLRFRKGEILTQLADNICRECYRAEILRAREMDEVAEREIAKQRAQQAEIDALIVQPKKRAVHIRKEN